MYITIALMTLYMFVCVCVCLSVGCMQLYLITSSLFKLGLNSGLKFEPLTSPLLTNLAIYCKLCKLEQSHLNNFKQVLAVGFHFVQDLKDL